MEQELINAVSIWAAVVAALALLVIIVAGFRAFPAEDEPTQAQVRAAKFVAALGRERYDADGVQR